MISVYLNQQLRSDVAVETGGSLEQTSEHATSSSLALKIPVQSDNLQDCDYIQIYDGSSLIYAGTILKCEQREFVRPQDFRIYDIDITGNADFVASVYVDLGFPAGANINQILFGNAADVSGYSADMPTFPGVLTTRIEAEGITVGTVDDFSQYVLEGAAYLWGKTVSSLLDDLCDTAGAWWEITPDKVFNMRYEYNLSPAPFYVDQNAKVFDLSVSKDALTFYSACRVIGGVGSSAINSAVHVLAEQPAGMAANAQYMWQESATTIKTNPPITAAYQVVQEINGQAPTDPATPHILNVGFKGIDDDDPQCQALMTYGSDTIETKGGYEFLPLGVSGNTITVTNAAYQVDIYARVVDPALTAQISAKRGGTGIVEYSLEDDSITSFSQAYLAATTFLKTFAQRAVEISFSTFQPCAVGQKLSVDLPYYRVSGSYTITKVTASFVLDKESQAAVVQYDVTASNIKYRDPYKALFYTAPKVAFSLDSNENPADGVYINNTVVVQTTLAAYSYTANTWAMIQQRATSWSLLQQYYPSWQELETSAAPFSWSQIQNTFTSWATLQKVVTSWAWLQSLTLEEYIVGQYLTDAGRAVLVAAMQGTGQASNTDFFGTLTVNTPDASIGVQPQDTEVGSNGGIATYYIAPNEINFAIESFSINENNTSNGTPFLLVPVNIDHTGGSTGSSYALTVSVQTIIT